MLLIASVSFMLLALEVGLRLRAYKEGWAYQWTNFRGHHILAHKSNDPAAFDAELGWVPKQGVWGGRHRGRPVVTILQDGIRPNGRGEVPDRTDAILAVGDSFTFGAQVSDRETWPAQLEVLSGRRVINGGVFAYGIDQAFLRARRLLSRYRFSTLIFSFIPHDIQRCQLSERDAAGKPYFDFKNGRLTLENVPVPPLPRPPLKESELFIALGHSLFVHTVLKRLFPEWWLAWPETQVQDEEKGRQVACALLHELEGLAKTRGFELIVLAQHAERETSAQSMAVERVLSCISDPATRVLDLKPALSALKANDPSRYKRLFNWHMTAEGNQFVALEISKILTKGERYIDMSGLSPAR